MKGPLPPSVDPKIQAALGSVYATFAGSTPRVIEGCPCCIGTRNVDVLLSTPLRDLTGTVLWRYVSGAFLTIGSERDFRYLLPRIFELAICDPGELPDVEIVIGKLRLANWSAWSERERETVRHLLNLWFDHALARDMLIAEHEGLATSDAESLLCGAARAGLDLSPWLIRLRAAEAELIRAFLAEQYRKDLIRGSPASLSFWADARDGWNAFALAIS